MEFCSEAEIKSDFLHSNVFSKPEDVEGNLFGLSPVFFLLDKMGLSFVVDIDKGFSPSYVFIQFEYIYDLRHFYLEVLSVDEDEFIAMVDFSEFC
ncbi:hypothetical protein [Flavobacterium lacisediminis]|uniref:Uncharacterized protein n=1 Tax=Flavobacterium lacisediminis TaxID=2989705 RepID=A0ABT3EHI8_9FLAO|nr:hypothetical protein [Flavobacterium lacisediminis]MCW1148045.1 hypothetical protein [Flavobacterium lacisediminis]